MRMGRGLALLLFLAACNRGNDTPPRRADGSLVTNSGGDVALSDGSQLQFVITSERYKEWDAAQRTLDRVTAAQFGALLRPKFPTQQSIDRATAYLGSDVRARQGIERTGMSVRDFVLMTVSLQQEMQLSRARPHVDTAFPPLPALPNVAPQSPDTTLRDTTVRRDTLAPSKPPRDTTLP